MKVVKWLCRCTSFISSLELKLNFWVSYSNCQRDSAFLEQNSGCRSPGFLIPDYLQREDQSLKCDSQDIDIRRK